MAEIVSSANPQALAELGEHATIAGNPINPPYGRVGVRVGDTVYLSNMSLHKDLLLQLAEEGVPGLSIRRDRFGDDELVISPDLGQDDLEGFRVSILNGIVEIVGGSSFLTLRDRNPSREARLATLAILRRSAAEVSSSMIIKEEA